jgi:anti-anti-sigma regulatory factor
MSQNPSVTVDAPVMIRVERVDLLSVSGQLDDSGLERLQCRLDELLGGGTRLLVADLSGVASCDGRLFDLLARTQRRLGCRGGWLRLVGLEPADLGGAGPGGPAGCAAGVPGRAVGR